tara:strand:+ start:112 stop:642 length:531 start_codon:yes stop_codon:yes gene_type:complete
MAKKRDRPKEEFYKMGEIETTKQYIDTLNKIRKEKGVMAAIGYEAKSSLHSLGKRVGNFFDFIFAPNKYLSPEESKRRRESTISPLGGRFVNEDYREWEAGVENRSARRKEFLLRGKKLEKATATTAILGIVAAIFFLSPNLTGNVIGTTTGTTSNLIGVGCLVIGLIAGYFYFKK